MELKEKVAIVTGGGSGIGRGICLSLGKAGAKVVVIDVIYEKAVQVVNQLTSMSSEAIAYGVDVTKSSDIRETFQQIVDKYGAIDVLVNNAGIVVSSSIVDLDETTWDRVFAVNVKGVFLCSKIVAPHMISRKQGKIINIASVAGKRSRAYLAAYAASKFAVIGFSHGLADELAQHNINVNIICPGIVYTDMWKYLSQVEGKRSGLEPNRYLQKNISERIPLQRPQTPEDIGELVVFLASDRAKNITGQAINVDGGMVMS